MREKAEAAGAPDQQEFLKRFLGVQHVLKAYLLSSCGDWNQAEDLLQEVSVVLLREFARYDRGRPFRAWALGIARLEVLKARQRLARRREVLSEEAMQVLAETAAECAEEVDSRRRHLQACVEKLDGDARDLMRMRYARALSIALVADQLGKSVGAVTMKLSRIRQALRACVDRRLRESAEGALA